jgi:hypothetical protein
MANQVVVWHNKHGDVYYDASTPEMWAKSCLAILRDMNEFGHLVAWEIPEKFREVDPMSVPEGHYRDLVESDNKRHRSQAAEYTKNNDNVAHALDAIKNNDVALVTRGRGRFEHQEPRIWELLTRRRDYEYERVELVAVRTPE